MPNCRKLHAAAQLFTTLLFITAIITIYFSITTLPRIYAFLILTLVLTILTRRKICSNINKKKLNHCMTKLATWIVHPSRIKSHWSSLGDNTELTTVTPLGIILRNRSYAALFHAHLMKISDSLCHVNTCWERTDLFCVVFFLKLYHIPLWCPGSGMTLYCIDSRAMPSFWLNYTDGL